MARKPIPESEIIDISSPKSEKAPQAPADESEKSPAAESPKASKKPAKAPQAVAKAPAPSLYRYRTLGCVSYMTAKGRRDAGPGSILEDLPDDDAAKMLARGTIVPC